MKLKSLVIIALLVLGCSAAFAQTYTFGLLTSDAALEFCNYELFATGGNGNAYLTGYDVLDLCPYSPNAAAPIIGFAIKPSTAAFSPVNGKGIYVYADALQDAYFNYYSGIQLAALTKTSIGKIKFGNYGWANYAGFGAFSFLNQFGFLTDTLPSAPGAKSTGKTSVFAGSKTNAKSIGSKTVQLQQSIH